MIAARTSETSVDIRLRTRQNNPEDSELHTRRRENLKSHTQILNQLPKIICPATRHGGAWEERRYSSYSFTTSVLDGVIGQRHAQAALYPRGKNPRYPLYRRLGGPQSRSGHRGYRKDPLHLLGSNLDRLVVQSVARHYTDWATPAPVNYVTKSIFFQQQKSTQ
jgi:hypothetical protein